ncbi:MAG TPA: RNA 2',3'-cyclic phosphodiesterase [Geothrix sp.]|nr:RNA 2',3'-cyclic phosphodiesterase [Geothrix sp.]
MEARLLRLFFGLPLPPGMLDALDGWERATPEVTGWTRPQGLHLTLAFLGAREAGALPALEACAAGVALRHAPLDLCTATLGAFPGAKAARIFWLGLAPAPALEALAADLRDALAAAGETFDARPFRPHLTLARFRPARPLPEVTPPGPLGFRADLLMLFESLSQGGYAAVRAWHLRAV